MKLESFLKYYFFKYGTVALVRPTLFCFQYVSSTIYTFVLEEIRVLLLRGPDRLYFESFVTVHANDRKLPVIMGVL